MYAPAKPEGTDVEIGHTTSGRIYVGIPGVGCARITAEHAWKLHDLLLRTIADVEGAAIDAERGKDSSA